MRSMSSLASLFVFVACAAPSNAPPEPDCWIVDGAKPLPGTIPAASPASPVADHITLEEYRTAGGTLKTGGRLTTFLRLFLGEWQRMVRPAAKVRSASRLEVEDGVLHFDLLDQSDPSNPKHTGFVEAQIRHVAGEMSFQIDGGVPIFTSDPKTLSQAPGAGTPVQMIWSDNGVDSTKIRVGGKFSELRIGGEHFSISSFCRSEHYCGELTTSFPFSQEGTAAFDGAWAIEITPLGGDDRILQSVTLASIETFDELPASIEVYVFEVDGADPNKGVRIDEGFALMPSPGQAGPIEIDLNDKVLELGKRYRISVFLDSEVDGQFRVAAAAAGAWPSVDSKGVLGMTGAHFSTGRDDYPVQENALPNPAGAIRYPAIELKTKCP